MEGEEEDDEEEEEEKEEEKEEDDSNADKGNDDDVRLGDSKDKLSMSDYYVIMLVIMFVSVNMSVMLSNNFWFDTL